MTARQRDWPSAWLMTDERMGEGLWNAIDRLPSGAGIVFRHYGLPKEQRAALARRVASLCLSRNLILAVGADTSLGKAVGADLIHNPTEEPSTLPFSRSVHSLAEAQAARNAGAAIVFVSPVFPTRSHPGRAALGPADARRIAEAAGVPAIALGGMNALNFAKLRSEGFHGWAGIDAWLDEDGA